MRFGHPEALLWLWLVPLLGLFYVISARTRSRRLHRLLGPQMSAALAPRAGRARRWVKAALVMLAAAALLAALARPQWGFAWEEVQRRGVDIVIALDVSDSMRVTDAGAGGADGGLSRLTRARREISDLLGEVTGDRVALVAFAGTAFVECPLTLDYGAARIFLRSIDTDLIPVPGTDLAAAVRTSLAAFEDDGAAEPSRAILLITDGEDHSGEALAAAEEAARAGVRIFAIGVGQGQGTPIPDPAGGFRRDDRGEIILSRLDEATLKRMAVATGGRYARSVTGDLDLAAVYTEGIKAVLEDQELVAQRRKRWHERFQWPLAVALAALMLEGLLPRGGGRRGDTPHA